VVTITKDIVTRNLIACFYWYKLFERYST